MNTVSVIYFFKLNFQERVNLHINVLKFAKIASILILTDANAYKNKKSLTR